MGVTVVDELDDLSFGEYSTANIQAPISARRLVAVMSERIVADGLNELSLHRLINL